MKKLWSLLQKIKGKIRSSTGGLWNFPTTCGFFSEKSKDNVDSQEFNKKENKRKIKRGKQLEEREIHLNKRENMEKIKG